jgi:hypothetical protein
VPAAQENLRGQPSFRGSSQTAVNDDSGQWAIGQGTQLQRGATVKLLWECAGHLGIDPANLTLRELLMMDEARGRAEWSQISTLMALIVNLFRDDRKSQPAKPEDFKPYQMSKRQAQRVTVPVTVLRDLWVKNDR